MTAVREERRSLDPMLVAVGIEKTFGRTRALAGANLTLAGGSVHALLGANGAGKSTFSRIIAGQIRHDGGSLTLRGTDLVSRSPRDAIAAGIAVVMQETSLAPDLSVLENIFLPELGLPGRLSRPSMRKRARDVLDSLGQFDALPLDTDVGRLSSAQRQLVEIAKALALDAQLIIFDEPTAALSPGEVERLFKIIARLRDAGRALVFVSHRLEEVLAITDRVTVMREGRTVAEALDTASLSQSEIIRHMVGQEIHVAQDVARRDRSNEAIVFEVSHLRSAPEVRDVSFTLRGGEILGLAGLVGAGRSETVETIFGSRPKTGGEMRLLGQPYAPRRPGDAVRAGIGLVPEDRRRQSIVPDFTVLENLLIGHLSAHRGPLLGYKDRNAAVASLMDKLGLPANRLRDPSMLNFSGGMQQKIIVARWLLLEPKVLILDEPTKGVDIGTRTTIYALLREVAARGTGILVISSDFVELLTISERVVVISDGMSIAEMPSAVLDEEKLTLFAAPRSSMERNAQILRDLTADLGGAAFWVLLDGGRVFCLNIVTANPNADPGFATGRTPSFQETRIGAALQACARGFITEPDGCRATLLTQVRSPLGHDLGWIGITLSAAAPLPDADDLHRRVQSLFAASV